MYRHFAIAAAALFLAGAGAAHAQSETVSVKVPYGDLDMSRGAGQAVFQNRIAHAVNVVCGDRPFPGDLGQLQDYRACRKEALASADRQLAAISGVKLAKATLVRPSAP